MRLMLMANCKTLDRLANLQFAICNWTFLSALLCAAVSAGGQAPAAPRAHELPSVPQKLPGWLDSKDRNHIFYRRGRYNFDVYKLPKLARDLNAVAVGHAMAYEDLVTGKAAQLE